MNKQAIIDKAKKEFEEWLMVCASSGVNPTAEMQLYKYEALASDARRLALETVNWRVLKPHQAVSEQIEKFNKFKGEK